MGVITTPNIYKALTFDGASSRTYGVYITGEAVYNAPERAVEMISIPGRNGAFVLDQGHFENIEVSYPAGIFAENEEDFAEAISDFRNYLCSKNGYCRLTDEYNPGEYRLAVYKSGLEVTTAQLRAGEFNIIFDCMPQRFLKSGETKVTLTSGNSITNPTLYDAHPLLELYGYGDVEIGDSTISVPNSQLGIVVIAGSDTGGATNTVDVQDSWLNAGNTMTIDSVAFNLIVGAPTGKTFNGNSSYSAHSYYNFDSTLSAGGLWNVYVQYAPQTFVKGTSSNVNTTLTASYGLTDGTTNTVSFAFTYSYNGNGQFTFSVSITGGSQFTSASVDWSAVIGNSTQSALGNPLYIDLEIGEAYKVGAGYVASVNNAVSIPAKLPVLPSGSTTITFSNTFTKVDIVPRWWKI